MNNTKELQKLMDGAGKVLLISHRKPDADTLGSAIALGIWLKNLGKEVTLACVDKPDPAFDFLPYIHDFVDSFELEKFDLVGLVDAGASYMTNFHLKYENLFKGEVPLLNIDHHASNDNFGSVNIVDVQAASTKVIIYKLFRELGVEINNEMATCLLAGIYGDTGGFMHSNTDKLVYEIAADLMMKGANVAAITKALFRSKPLETLRIWGRVLEKTTISEDNVVMSIIKDEDYGQVGASPENLSGVIDYLNMVPNSRFAVLINEDRCGNVKGSFRTRESDLDLSRIAAVFGGGGHPKASGFLLPGKIEEEMSYKIVAADLSKRSLQF